MAWKVTVTPDVARTRAGDSGSRNVRVGDKLYTFNRNAVILDELPDEVKNDKRLVVVEASAADKSKPSKPTPAPPPELVEAGAEDVVEVVDLKRPDDAPVQTALAKPAGKRGRPRKAK